MKFEPWLKVYGELDYRGECPQESAEQITFFGQLRAMYPETLGKLALHPKNEEKRKGRQFQQLSRDKAMGLSPGASDIIIPGCPAFVCEMKRQDHTKSKWQDGQLKYLEEAHKAGAFVCVALGWKAAIQAVRDWQESIG
jgi:hypothetical protein